MLLFVEELSVIVVDVMLSWHSCVNVLFNVLFVEELSVIVVDVMLSWHSCVNVLFNVQFAIMFDFTKKYAV